MPRTTITSIIFVASTFFIGCDWPPIDVPPPPECGQVGQLFGPCPEDTHLCAPGLICLDSLPNGTICGVDSETGPTGVEVVACAAQFGARPPSCDFFNGDCYSPCEGDADCLGGTTCSLDWGACVWPPGTGSDACMADGGLYGACVDNQCADGLSCFSGLAGEMCVRQSAPTQDDESCASGIGGGALFTEQLLYGAWLIDCDNDADCAIGTVCEENIGACLHPYGPHNVKPPPGFGLGPCDVDGTCGYHLDQCFEANNGSGNICTRPDRPEWLAPCSKVEPDCPNGQVCATDDEVCVWPK